MSDDARGFLEEADYEKHPAFFTKDSKVGDTLSGTICEEPRKVMVDGLNPGEGQVPKLVLAIEDSAGKVWSLWLSKNKQAAAVAKAAKDVTGVAEVKKGGKLHLRYTGDGERNPAKPAHNAPKLWAAKYEPPAPVAEGADQADIFGDLG